MKTKLPLEIALGVVKADPDVSTRKLARQMVREVQAHEDMVDIALMAQCEHLIIIAKSHLARQKAKPAKKAKSETKAAGKRLAMTIMKEIFDYGKNHKTVRTTFDEKQFQAILDRIISTRDTLKKA